MSGRYTAPDPGHRAAKRLGRAVRHAAGLARTGDCTVCRAENVPVRQDPSTRAVACDTCFADRPGEPQARMNRAARRRALHRPGSVR